MVADRGIQTLIIGANGLVGRKLGEMLRDEGIEWIGTYNKRQEEGLLRLDITIAEEVKAIFERYSPKAVFHCANLAGGVDFCERNPEIAGDFHLNATKDIGNRCKDIGATLVFISTDYVFDGTKGPYREDDSPNPLNLYGRLKLQAEQWIQKNLERYLIIRTTNVYGWDPKTATPNYIMNLYRALKEGKSFNVPSFLWGNPTYVGDLTKAIVELWMDNAKGVFHVVGSSFINRYQWAIEACNILGLDKSLINEIKQPSAAMVPRPLRSWLSTDKFTGSYETILNDVYDGLRLMKKDIQGSKIF